MFKFFKSDVFNFEFLRVLAVASFYGSETGECLEARTKITDGDPESWYRAWTSQAERAVKVAEEASKHGDRVEASWAFIRASNYYRSSEFFLHCNAQDPRILDAIQKSSNTFERGVRLLDGELYTFDIPFEDNISLPARLFLPPAHKRVTEKLPILVQNRGFDSTQEELYFYGPAGALPRGYAVLTYDGPGQGISLRRDKTRMVPDWERVTAKVLDYLESKLAVKHNIDMDQIAVSGASLGGYLALRAAGDPRVKAAISIDGCYDLFDVTKSRMPNWFIGGWLSGWLSDGFFNFVVNRLTAGNFQLRWEFGHSMWLYGVDNPADVMRQMQRFTLRLEDGKEYLDKLKCATLVTGASDTFYFVPDINAERIYEKLGHLDSGKKELWVVEIDMQNLIQSLAVDIIGITTFGQSFNVVQNGSHPLPDQIKKALKLAGLLMLVPWIRNIPFLPARDPYVDKFTSDAVENRRAIVKTSKKQDLLQKLVEAGDDSEGSIFRRSDIQDEAIILLTAGSETTANAELFTLIMLTRNKDKMAKLVAEVDQWYPPSEPGKIVDCEYSFLGMTYLQACIDETMRLVPGQATGSPRECLKDEKVLGYTIPKGTTVFPSTQNVHMDEKVWPNATEFLPERWLDIYASGKTNEVAFWPFSAGSRVCIGKHFALQEMHMTLVSLFRRFEFEYIPQQDETTVFRVAQQLQAHQYMIKVKRRSF
ncbi:cytochrome P450 [Trichoderma compactum]